VVKSKVVNVIVFSAICTSAVEVFFDGTPPEALGFRTCHRYQVVKVVIRRLANLSSGLPS
jgi:hypothetical protein